MSAGRRGQSPTSDGIPLRPADIRGSRQFRHVFPRVLGFIKDDAAGSGLQRQSCCKATRPGSRRRDAVDEVRGSPVRVAGPARPKIGDSGDNHLDGCVIAEFGIHRPLPGGRIRAQSNTEGPISAAPRARLLDGLKRTKERRLRRATTTPIFSPERAAGKASRTTRRTQRD